MSHEWHRGVLDKSSWHGLEEIGVMATADDMIDHGKRSKARADRVELVKLVTCDGLPAPGKGVVATYADGERVCLANVGDRFRPAQPEDVDALYRAAFAAGAKPTGIFSLRDGTRQLGTFEVGVSNGLRTQLLIADAFDGSMQLSCGFTTIRVVCANTLAVAFGQDGAGMAKLRHTSSIDTKINVLSETIGTAIKSGEKMRDAYHTAENLRLDKAQAMAIFDKLFPEAPADAEKAARTRAEGERADARKAMWRAENDAKGTLATLWNAATWLVDREANGEPRESRGDALDSLLFGSRARRVQEIYTIVDVIMRDGSVRSVPHSEALELGADPEQIRRAMVQDMFSSPTVS